jgi:hypothetical protein
MANINKNFSLTLTKYEGKQGIFTFFNMFLMYLYASK